MEVFCAAEDIVVGCVGRATTSTFYLTTLDGYLVMAMEGMENGAE